MPVEAPPQLTVRERLARLHAEQPMPPAPTPTATAEATPPPATPSPAQPVSVRERLARLHAAQPVGVAVAEPPAQPAVQAQPAQTAVATPKLGKWAAKPLGVGAAPPPPVSPPQRAEAPTAPAIEAPVQPAVPSKPYVVDPAIAAEWTPAQRLRAQLVYGVAAEDIPPPSAAVRAKAEAESTEMAIDMLKSIGLDVKYSAKALVRPAQRTAAALDRTILGVKTPLWSAEWDWINRRKEEGTITDAQLNQYWAQGGGNPKTVKQLIDKDISARLTGDQQQAWRAKVAGEKATDVIYNLAGWLILLRPVAAGTQALAGGTVAPAIAGGQVTAAEVVAAKSAAHVGRLTLAGILGTDTYLQARAEGASDKEAGIVGGVSAALFYVANEAFVRVPDLVRAFVAARRLGAPFRALGIKPGATQAEIQAVYRSLAKKIHPDAPGGSAKEFIRLRANFEAAMRQATGQPAAPAVSRGLALPGRAGEPVGAQPAPVEAAAIPPVEPTAITPAARGPLITPPPAVVPAGAIVPTPAAQRMPVTEPIDLAPPRGLEAAEAAVEGGPPGRLQQRLAERAAAAPEAAAAAPEAPAAAPSAQEALRRYEREKGYIRVGAKHRKTKANLQKVATAKADEHYQELKKAAGAERREEGKTLAAENRAEAQAAATAGLKAGKLTPEHVAHLPIDSLDADVQNAIRSVAEAVHGDTQPGPTRDALQKIIDGGGKDVGAAVEKKKARIVNILMEGQGDYWRPGGMIPPVSQWDELSGVSKKLKAGLPIVEVPDFDAARPAEEGLASQLKRDESGAITVDLKGIDRIRDTLGALFSDEYGRPPEWLAGNRKANAARRIAADKAARIARSYRKNIRDAGLTKAEAVETHMLVEAALRGTVPMDKLSPVVRQWVEQARELLDEESRIAAQRFREAGMETLAQVYEQNIGTYLKNIPKSAVSPVARSKAFVGRLLGPRLSRAFGKVKRDAYILKVNNKVAGKFATEDQAKVAYYQAIERKKNELINKMGQREGVHPEHLYRAAARQVQLIEPIPDEWRIENEIHYPPFLVARSIIETRHNGEIVGLFSWAAKKWGQEAPPRMGAGELATWAKENGLAKLPESAGLHDLRGMYVPKAIAEDLTELIRAPGTAMQFYRTYITAWKAAKTIWNPATHGRNVMGNPFFTYLGKAAIWNPLNILKYVKGTIEVIKWQATGTASPDIQQLLEGGQIGNEFFGAELKQLDTYVAQGDDLTRLDQAIGSLKALHNLVGRIYAAEDQVFKLGAYKVYRARGMTETEAAAEVDTWMPNYARTCKVTRWLRSTPIAGAPFISFFDQCIRIGLRAARKHPLRLASIIAMPGILTYITTLLLGMSDEERELVDKDRSYFEPLIPFRDKNGRVLTIDLRYIIPLANDLAPEMRGEGVRIPWIFSGPLFEFTLEQLTGKERFTGRTFIPQGKDATTREKAEARARQAFKTLAPVPSWMTYGLGLGQDRPGRIQRAAEGDSEETLARAILGTFSGINIRSPYIAEKHVKTIIGNMLEEKDVDQAKAMLKMWNDVYRPGYRTELTLGGIAKGRQQSKAYYWGRYRDEAAEFLMQGKTDEVQRSIDNYHERHPGGKKLPMGAIEARVRQWRAQGRIR